MSILNNFVKRKYKFKLKIQLLCSFVIMSVILLFAGSILAYFGMINILNRESRESTLQQFNQVENNVGMLFSEIDRFSKILIVNDTTQQYLFSTFSDDLESSIIKMDTYTVIENMLNLNNSIDSIYMFREDGIIIGSSLSKNYFEKDKNKAHWFYNSSINVETEKFPARISWNGVYYNNDFNLNDPADNNIDNFLISGARSLRILKQGMKAATLIVNIKEKTLNYICNFNIAKKENSIYIVDDTGKIISHTDKKLINSQCIFFDKIQENQKYGNFMFVGKDTSEQIVYGKIGDMGWTMIKEIPLNVLYRDIYALRGTVFEVFFLGLVLAVVMSFSFIFRITKPMDNLVIAMKELGKGNLGITLSEKPNSEIGILWEQFNKMSIGIKTLLEKIKNGEEEKRVIEIEVLKAQINPHFIYNTLNTIKWMSIVAGVKNVTDSLTVLGNLLVPIFRSHSIFHTLDEEVKYIENYLKIMNYRFGNRLKIEIILDEIINSHLIPQFIIQPIVENAIVHNMQGTELYLNLFINIIKVEMKIHIVIEDDGVGMSSEKLKEVSQSIEEIELSKPDFQESIGLYNIRKRLDLHYGDHCSMKIENRLNSGTKVIIKLPLSNKS